MNAEIKQVTDLLRRRWLVVLTVFLLGIALMPFAAAVIPAYKGTADLLIVSQALNKDTTASDPDLPSILSSTEVLTRVIDRLKLHMDSATLAKRIKTKLPARSSILELTYKDTNAQRAADVANAVADESVAYFHDIATLGYNNVIADMERRIAQSKATIASADKRLQSASANSGFESSDKALDDLTSEINDLRVQRGQLGAALAADQASVDALKHQLQDIGPIVRGEILQRDVVYQNVQTVVGKDTADLISERASFTDSFPGLGALAKRLASERAQATATAAQAVQNGAGESSSYTQSVLDLERATGTVSEDQQRLKATDAELAQEQKHLRQVSGAGAEVGTLRAERDAALQQYMALTQRLSTAQGDAAQAASLGSLVVVSRAVPGGSAIFYYLLGIALVAVLLGIAASYAFDAADKRFWGDREIERVYGRPVLAKLGAA
jgi:uncharacterized protein involved in exopolysaccharide biosynthesis